jgi:hypothetical protein
MDHQRKEKRVSLEGCSDKHIMQRLEDQGCLCRESGWYSRPKAKAKAPIFGDEMKSLGRSLHFTCNALEQGRQASARFKMLLATIGLVCPEARVKFTEADFASYCNIAIIL